MSTDAQQSGERRATSSNNRDFNAQLNQLAEKCGNPKEHVVLVASQCEDLFHSSPEVNVVSFNTLLKAWSKTCATLAENKGSTSGKQQQQSSSDIPSVPVYTARDAAEHATNLLLEMERAVDESDDDDSDESSRSIVPDTTSFNCVIGMLCSVIVFLWKFLVESGRLDRLLLPRKCPKPPPPFFRRLGQESCRGCTTSM